MEDQRDVRYGYLVTGGSDRRLRFWDVFRVENSCVFSGLVGATTATNSPDAQPPGSSTGDHHYHLHSAATKPVFVSATLPNQPGLALNLERWPRGGSSSGGGEKGTGTGKGGGKAAGAGATGREKPPRHTVISAEQAQLLRSHLDAVLDVAVLEMPYAMTVSVDRSGVIFVFQ